MSEIIKTFDDGSFLEYGRGSFDDWCVFYTNSNGVRNPPKDIEYFTDIKNFSIKYGSSVIYNDYVEIYNMTNNSIDFHVLDKITLISKKYNEDSIKINIIFSILYMGMIAEEQKAFTKLGKRIKRLGMHKLLKENVSPYEAANFMKGMNWRTISLLCQERGF